MSGAALAEFEAFKEISAGGLAKEQLFQRLDHASIQFNEYARMLFEHRSFNPSRPLEKVKLVKVRLADLHLRGPCSLSDIVSRASRLGLKSCPLDLAAFLRLEYLDQPQGSYLTIVSARPENDETYPTGFYLRNFENSLWLRGYRVTGEPEWPPDNVFIFME